MKNIGSRATLAASSKAQDVSIGRERHLPVMPAKPRSTVRGSIHKGNIAGLNNEKPVRLEQNKTGYGNPSHQTARLKEKEPLRNEYSKPTINSRINKDESLDLRLCKSKDNSIAKLKKLRR